jgi:hypothetical protein
MNELIAYFEMLIRYAEVKAPSLNAASQKALAQLMQQFAELIESQSQENIPSEPPTLPTSEINQAMPSSNVEGFSYDDKKGKLYVRFLGDYPNRNGPVYQYENVPPQIVDLFMKGAVPARTNGRNKWGKWWKGKVPSLGASMYAMIKTQNYPYRRVG